ncbi:hypothetical protein Scep_018683 [Stephania cephalantha]|uniref:Erythromycin biosynthesis protein CIII-like C-terminal domain-containing protein n=1 Tax=Stephania cephalantha TaxID=152367 RepID=A0AAP0I9H5_9MAGN
MAFGTKGDVNPIAGVAAAFAADQSQYLVYLITHSAHENLSDVEAPDFALKKKAITSEHRLECLKAMEMIIGDGPSLQDDFIVINFFALEGWSLAELFHVRCVVAAPYVVPYRYGFSKEVVECPVKVMVVSGYWPSNARVCGFWFLPMEWQFSCSGCRTNLDTDCPGHLNAKFELCAVHTDLQSFLTASTSDLPIFIGLSSVGRQVLMGFLKNPQAFLRILGVVVEITNLRFILFSAGYEPLDCAINVMSGGLSSSNLKRSFEGFLLFDNRVFCFSGAVPYSWLFPKCAVAVHHGGSGSTAAALLAGVPQVICPFLLDQFYWAERMFWLGVSPEPLHKDHLLPDQDDEISIKKAATSLSNAIRLALSPDTKALAANLARRISSEDGVGEAVKILKEEIVRCCQIQLNGELKCHGSVALQSKTEQQLQRNCCPSKVLLNVV